MILLFIIIDGDFSKSSVLNEYYGKGRFYYMKTNFLTTLQRIVAAFADLFLISLMCVIILRLTNEDVYLIAFIVLTLLFPFRDIFFGGRSIGKRLLRLVIINTDEENCFEKKVPIGRMLLRQVIFIFFGFIEIIILLITGKTLGDRVSKTAVVSKNRMDDQMLYFEERQELQERENRIAQEVELHRIVEEKRRLARNGGVPQAPSAPKSTNIYAPENQQVYYYEKTPMSTRKKIVISVAVILLVAILAFLGSKIIPSVMITSSDGYKAAYEYLINTNSFTNSDAKEEDIKFLTMERREEPYNSDPKERIIIEYHFTVKEQYIKIFCHEYKGHITVCRTCTQYK